MRNFPGCHKGQGATEYLVLLAVVLIVALVSVALLGFFPGMASDAQMTQSKMYWSSASPIAIVENSAARYDDTYTEIYIRIRNTGTYPVRITRLLDSSGGYISQFRDNDAGYLKNITDYMYMTPGEEKYFGRRTLFSGLSEDREVAIRTAPGSSIQILGGAASICTTGANTGTLVLNNFGFEYIQYIENTQITKRQIGAKPLVIKCT